MAIKTILVIEDDRFIGEMYVRSLQREGYSVDWMVDGHDGYVAAINKPYDLILLDIMLPEMRGIDILKALRSPTENKIPTSKVVVLTNFDQDLDSRADMQSNADAYLIKADITPHKLVEIIKEFDAAPPTTPAQ
ncbi:MAG: response regulator [Candidatus Saccharimonas sp.]